MKAITNIINKTIIDFLNENLNNGIKFNVKTNDKKFELYLNDDLVSESYYDIENPDNLFSKKYVGLFKLETLPKYRGKGYMTNLLNEIFKYVKSEIKVNYILLNVYRNNENALKLYLKNGFEIYKYFDDEDYYTLIKNL